MSSRLLLAAGLLAASLPAQTSEDASFGTFPFLVGNMDPQIPALVQAATSNDLDTIYVSVFRAEAPGQGTLWITDTARQWNPAWGPVRPGGKGIDLAALVRAAHAANLQVVGVLKCFDDSVQPTNASHRAFLLQVVDYLMNTYDLGGRPYYDMDGLALDYVRYVGAGCGNNPRFVTDFVRDVKARIGARTLHAYLIASRYYFDGPPYNGTFNSYSTVMSSLRSCYGQDWEALARYLDVLTPMAYTANGSIYSSYSLHQAYVRTVASYARVASTRAGFVRRVSPAIRTWSDSNETATPQTIEASITGALAGGGDGYQAFRYATIQSQTWWAKMKQYAAPGPNRPIPALSVTAQGLTATADATASKDFDEPSSSLTVRIDVGNDGTWETPWSPNVPIELLTRQPGPMPFGLQVKDSNGNVGATARQPSIPGPLFLDTPILSSLFGGSVRISLDAGPAAAGHGYLVTASLAGSSPGTVVAPGLVLPLNVDSLTFGLISAVNTPLLQNGFATLDAQGKNVAVFSVPPGVLGAIRGQTMTWAALGADPVGAPAFVSNPGTLFIGF